MAGAVSITVDGAPTSLQFAGFSIDHRLGGRDTARIRLLNARPNERTPVAVTVDEVLRFGGLIATMNESGPITKEGAEAYFCDADVIGWDAYHDTRMYTGDRPEETLAARLAVLHALVSGAPANLTLDVGASSPTLAAQSYKRRYLADIYRELQSQAQWAYRVAPDRTVVWRSAADAPACPFAINLTGGARPVGDVRVKRGTAGYANKVWVIGGDASNEVVAEAHDDVEIGIYGLIEITVAAPNVTTAGAAQALADGLLAWRKQHAEEVSIAVETPGAWPGQAVAITLPQRGLTGSFFIQGVNVRALTPETILYTLTATSFASAQGNYLDVFRSWSGSGSSIVSALVGTGGSGMATYQLGGSDFVGEANTDGLAFRRVPHGFRVRLTGAEWSGRVVSALVWTRADDAGVSITPRVWNDTAGVAAGTGVPKTGTDWQFQSILLTIAGGANEYFLEMAPNAANAAGYAYGYIEGR